MSVSVWRKIVCCVTGACFVLLALYSPAAGAAARLPAAAAARLKEAVVLYTGSSSAFVNNAVKTLDASPVVKNSRTLVPVRFIAESLGARVDYDAETKTVTVGYSDRTVKMVLGSRQITVNGRQSTLDVPAESLENRTFIPLRALTEALGKKVFYSGGLIVISDCDGILDAGADSGLIQAIIAGFGQENAPQQQASAGTLALKLIPYNGGIFTVNMPAGWQIKTAGDGSTFSFLIRDPGETSRQIFYCGEVGPLYLLEEQRKLDQWYMSMGGYPIQWIDVPVVNPLTPENFLQQFHAFMATRIAQGFMPELSSLDDVEIISSEPFSTPFTGGKAAVMRALFKHGGKLCEGLFSVSVAPLLPFCNMAGGGIGYAFMFTGMTAQKDEFRGCESDLLQSLRSFAFSQQYLNRCLQNQNQVWQGIFRTSQILSSTSDTIMQVWENRNRTEDILSEKRSDAILGRERLYDPDTGQVYEFDNGFYDSYNPNRGRYDMNNLQPLPDNDYNLWTAPPLNGYNYLH
ncbi:MAG: stalk domain-containing protein [Peptococcaceae bacterium]|jgi:hypothetical protein|nr:stalk domain-containing protein [Peptococcaceae bacterium]MDH7525632.1 stalk domain-containing protein [Peptococcaceae bacterium]